MDQPKISTPKKLIEVALPLEAINAASVREKSIRHGHPSTLHLWWARRPLAAARAVIFSQMVDDPSFFPDLFPTEKAQEKERKRLFKIIEDLVQWENTTNEEILNQARDEIWASWRRTCALNADHPMAKELFDRNKLPAFHDPFAGGGSIPLEAQRLGLEAWASDLNPVAVLINKAMIEIPPKFAGKHPVNQQSCKDLELIHKSWPGALGLAEDVQYYGQWMRAEAEKRIGHLYPKVRVYRIGREERKERSEKGEGKREKEYWTREEIIERYPRVDPDDPSTFPYPLFAVPYEFTVIAWIWARTVKSPNPAFRNVDVPLASTFMLSTRQGKEAYVEPVIENGGYRFTVKVGKPKDMDRVKRGTKAGGSGSSFLCLMSGIPIPFEYIRAEAKAGKMSTRLMAIVAEGDGCRLYLSPTSEMENIARSAVPKNMPETDLPKKALGFRIQEYGMTKWADLFTPRQLVALTTFSDLVEEAGEQVHKDALASGMADDRIGLADGGTGATAYAEAVSVYLAFALSKQADLGNNLCRWEPVAQCPRQLFGRHAIPMIWDFAEGNPLGNSSGAWSVLVDGIAKAFANTFKDISVSDSGFSKQADAVNQKLSINKIVSTDPPYYDNIGYADLSDFFYIWLRRSVRPVFPDLFSTLAVPKEEELVATPYRHGSREKAEEFFLDGMKSAMENLAGKAHPAFPVTIYYAFKQAESEGDTGTASTGWETFLSALIQSGFEVTGTWPIRTENYSRMISQGTNALASSIVLVCRKRPSDAPEASRREFLTALRQELPPALAQLQKGNIAPVDLAQSAIGPGMAVFSRYARVLDASGVPLTVRDALILINQTLDEVLAEQEGDLDPDSRWALAWFEQFGFEPGEYGTAETLSKAKDTSVNAMAEAGIITSGKGKVRLLKPEELDHEWDPEKDRRITVWETLHQLIRVFETGGEVAAAMIVKKLKEQAETSRELCYRLYTLCERKKRAAEALSYNALVQSWPEIQRISREEKAAKPKPGELFDMDGEEV
jgi:putative DNA methylase